MTSLHPDLRKLLENEIPNAREIAEEAARAILNILAVNRPEPFPGMTSEQRRLRNALRAKARQLGNGSQVDGFEPLVEELAYQQWHRMVFARFLAENNILMHPSGVPITLPECGELAQREGEVDAWAMAARYASLMLPGIFRQDDPESQVRLVPEGQQKLEAALNNLPSPIFLADNALGWMYQFWQSRKKDEINKSERKIGGADIAPVTQLFTEDYMVRFLLENSLGAWWASRHPDSPLLREWKYLRFLPSPNLGEGPGVRVPAAGAFPGWPELAAQVTLMDPCFGSGHILVAGFEMLVCMRMEEEGLSAAEAGDAVLRENLFGLELDPRCTQIAAFALALAAWKNGGYRSLPVPNVACAGIPVQGQLETWLKLAGEDSRLRAGLERLYGLFKNAPDLGSLINPADLPAADRMFVADYEQVAPVLEQALAKERNADPVAEVFGKAAEGVTRATKFLAGKYMLVTTNVPYLARRKQSEIIRDFSELNYPHAKTDLATVFIERCLQFCASNGSVSLVTPQNWLFLGTYKKLREKLLQSYKWNFVVRLGPQAFQIMNWWAANTALLILSNSEATSDDKISGLDVSSNKDPFLKERLLKSKDVSTILQAAQLKNPDARILLQSVKAGDLLEKYGKCLQGTSSADKSMLVRNFWEFPNLFTGWAYFQTSVNEIIEFGGKTDVLNLEYLEQNLISLGGAIRGRDAWGKKGVSVSIMRNLPVTLYLGDPFDANAHLILPQKEEYLGPIWAFCKSSEFLTSVRMLDQKTGVTNSTIGKVPFDYLHWNEVYQQEEPIPMPYSYDPTQWIFNGHPAVSTEPLQVVVARLLGYKWPQRHPDALDTLADEDGIVCLPSVAGEQPFHERLRELLEVAYGSKWSPRLQTELLSAAGDSGKTLEDWLRDDFFILHCRVFQNRPFLWHIWDGRKDGFSAVVNYHKLNSSRFDKLIYTYLGDWIRFQRARRDHGEPGADGRLVASLELEKKLKLIQEGEPPYDIYVRWKTLAEQAVGWNPDLNDGVRVNIRPFVIAGVLRSKFNLHWNKDRGKNPDGSDRINDLHYTITKKLAARKGSE